MNKEQMKTIRQMEETLTAQHSTKEAYDRHTVAEQKGIQYSKATPY